jgi:hypothetical protein
VGIDFVVLGFAALNRLQIERMPENKRNPFLLTEVREPLPGAQTLDAHAEVFSLWGKHPQKGFGRRGQIIVDKLITLWIKTTDVHCPCV